MVAAAGPLQVRLDEHARVRIGWGEPDWFGPARLAGVDIAPAGWRVDPSGVLTADGDRVQASLRACADEPVLVFRLEALTARRDMTTGDFATPWVAVQFEPALRSNGGAPAGVRAFGHQYTEFALPVFSDAAMAQWRLLPFRPAVVMPLGLTAPDGRTVLLAPLTGPHDQIIAVPPPGDAQADLGLRAGWHGDIGAVPAGYATELAVVAGHGARECFATWARLLRAASGVDAPRRDSDTLSTRVSYWTDNGSAYWYRTEPRHDPASSIVAAVDDLEARGLPVGAVQLDSWWYPHEVLRPFDTDDWVVPPSGMIRWEPRADVLPGGIADLRARLGRRPLVAHCRHLSSQSPYGEEFPLWVDGDRAHPQGPELYERLLDQAVAWGVDVFEHDWLIECYLGVRALRACGRAAAWQRALDDALGARNLHAQWCMASPADFAFASELHNVTSIRTSGDHGYLVGPELLWAWFLHTNVMARALGLWPYKDVFRAAPEFAEREVEALLSALSAGPVGIGDRAGTADVDLVRRTCRADGVLVRPDVPIAATDRSVYGAPVWSAALLVGSAHTQHSAGRWGYAVTGNVTADRQPASTRVALTDLGSDRPDTDEVVVYDWRARRIERLARGGGYDVALEPSGWDYRVVAPVLDGDLAVVGDPNLYATAGDARVADVVVDERGVTTTILGAGERVTVVGWARTVPTFRSWSPATRERTVPVSFDAATGLWELSVDIGPAGWTVLRAPLRS